MKDEITIGDEFVCMSNEGLWSIGDVKTVWGISDTSINFQPCLTSWIKKEDARLGNYRHVQKEPTQEIIDFQDKFDDVRKTIRKFYKM